MSLPAGHHGDRHAGRCLCGAVRVVVEGPLGGISACHCALCTRWGGGVQMGVAVPAGRVTITGPVKSHRSSRLAERAWCDTCGTSLYLRDVAGPGAAEIELCPGLFLGDMGDARLERVVYADRTVGGIELAGDVLRVSRADYEAEHPHLDEEPAP